MGDYNNPPSANICTDGRSIHGVFGHLAIRKFYKLASNEISMSVHLLWAADHCTCGLTNVRQALINIL